MDKSEIKNRILISVPIDVYIGRYVALKKQGRIHKGLCPFHTEKTPSFVVTPDKGIFHCFGCKKGGDIFTFVMEHDGVTFPEALQILSRYAGIEISPSQLSVADKEKQAQAEINKKAASEFSNYLLHGENRAPLNYLIQRGLTREAIEEFHLGASSLEWNWLAGKILGKESELLKAGLIRKNKRGEFYDFFRGRIIFPIHDETGTILGFGGRVLPGNEDVAKYLNSPETPLFQKSRVLYGIFRSLKSIRESRESFVSEGYLDVIGLYQAGIKNCVAPLGTALGMAHIQILQRHVKNIVFLMDGDAAGRAAALRSAALVVDHGDVTAEIVLLPPGMDPFDLVKGRSESEIHKILKNRFSAERYLLLENIFPELFSRFLAKEKNSLSNPFDFTRKAVEYYTQPETFYTLDIVEKRKGMKRLFEFVSNLKRDSDMDLFISEGARFLNINSNDLKREWLESTSKSTSQNHTSERNLPTASVVESKKSSQNKAGDNFVENARVGHESRLSRCEKEIVIEFIHNPSLVDEFYDEMTLLEFTDSSAEIIWRNLESRYITGENWSRDIFIQSDFPSNIVSAVSELMITRATLSENFSSSDGEENDSRIVIRELLNQHRLLQVKEKLIEVEERLHFADLLERENILREKYELIQEKRAFEQQRSQNAGKLEKNVR